MLHNFQNSDIKINHSQHSLISTYIVKWIKNVENGGLHVGLIFWFFVTSSWMSWKIRVRISKNSRFKADTRPEYRDKQSTST